MKPTAPIDNQALARFPAPGEVRLVRLLPGPIERVWSNQKGSGRVLLIFGLIRIFVPRLSAYGAKTSDRIS
jgi:hypothetical protein